MSCSISESTQLQFSSFLPSYICRDSEPNRAQSLSPITCYGSSAISPEMPLLETPRKKMGRREWGREMRSGLREGKGCIKSRKKGKRARKKWKRRRDEKRRGGRKRQGRGKRELNHFMGWIAGPLLQIIVFHVLLFLFGLFAWISFSIKAEKLFLKCPIRMALILYFLEISQHCDSNELD